MLDTISSNFPAGIPDSINSPELPVTGQIKLYTHKKKVFGGQLTEKKDRLAEAETI
jgi:hypothetical protein